MKYYVITYENGAVREGEFYSYSDAVEYAESFSGGWEYRIEMYDSYEDYEDVL